MTTMEHLVGHKRNISKSIEAVLLVGDLSYSDADQPRWDSWRHFVEKYFSKLPLFTLPGNHEEEKDAIDSLESNSKDQNATSFITFKPYASRFRMAPTCVDCAIGGYDYNGWKANMWYSVSIGSATIITLSSYHDFSKYTSDQYQWLSKTLASIDRSIAPWLIVSMHEPFYNSNVFHHNEKNAVGMKAAIEELLYEFKVDLVFAGHVHSYERMFPTFRNVTNIDGPVYINIGDGGNREGIYDTWLPGDHNNGDVDDSRPSWSANRRGSYGHGILTLHDSKMATWEWYRNEDPVWKIGDSVAICNKVFNDENEGCAALPNSNNNRTRKRSAKDEAVMIVAGIFAVLAFVAAVYLTISNSNKKKYSNELHDIEEAIIRRREFDGDDGDNATREVSSLQLSSEKQVLLNFEKDNTYESTMSSSM